MEGGELMSILNVLEHEPFAGDLGDLTPGADSDGTPRWLRGARLEATRTWRASAGPSRETTNVRRNDR